ncbi:MAG TPA: hypothetical protein VMF60_06395, partial [Acidimicrobiales bacterium]|nr:hypothetical protein [Acidimicrobiales bacterium]
MTGKPQSSSWMSSGTISAHSPRPVHRVGSTRIRHVPLMGRGAWSSRVTVQVAAAGGDGEQGGPAAVFAPMPAGVAVDVVAER